MIDVIIAAKNEIIGGLIVALLAWCWHKFRVLLKKYKAMKQELDRMKAEMTQIGATKEENERLTAELQHKDEILSQAEAKAQEDSRLITELRSQIEALQQEIQRKDEALSQTEAKSQEDSRLITELRSQVETLQQEKAKKKIPPMSDDDFVKLCMSGDIKKVEEAIMNGANINARDCVGWTALMMAAYKGYINIAEVLIKHGADVNIRTNTWTALSWATRYGHTETADLLRKYGAK